MKSRYPLRVFPCKSCGSRGACAHACKLGHGAMHVQVKSGWRQRTQTLKMLQRFGRTAGSLRSAMPTATLSETCFNKGGCKTVRASITVSLRWAKPNSSWLQRGRSTAASLKLHAGMHTFIRIYIMLDPRSTPMYHTAHGHV